jgi:O-antigen/teichoic acid export membrane protein
MWFTFAGVALKGMATLTTPIFTRLMSTEQFGLYALSRSWLQVLAVLTTLSLASGVFSKGMSKYPKSRDAYTASMQTVTTVLVLVALLAYLAFRDWANAFMGLTTVIVIAMFVELFFTPPVTFWMARERYDFKYRPVVLVTLLIAAGIAVVSVAAVAFSDDKGTARVVGGAVVPALVGMLVYGLNVKRAKALLSAEYAKFAVAFNVVLIPHYLSMYALDQLDRIMVAKLIGLSAAGVYSVGYTVGAAIRVATDSISSALIPWQYRQLEARNFQAVGHRLTQVFGLYGLMILAFVALAPELVSIVGGSAYGEALHVIPPVAVATFFIFAYVVFGNTEIYYESNKMMMLASPVAAVVNVILNYLLVPRFGFVAAGYTTLVCYAGLAAAHYAYMQYLVSQDNGGAQLLDTGRMIWMTVGLVVGAGMLVVVYPLDLLRYVLVAGAVGAAVVKRQEIKGILMTARQ